MPATPPKRAFARPILVALAAVLCPNPVATQDKPPPIDPALRSRFGFLDPIIKKLGYGTNMIQPVVWEKGAPVHVLVNNPHRAKLEDLFFKEKKLSSDSISTDGDLHGLATADVDGDGKQDILMVNSRGRLVIKLRDPSARAIPELEVGRGKIYDCLRCGDVDGDGKPDAILLTRDGLRTVTKLGSAPVVHPSEAVFATRIFSFHVTDFDADGILDVVICAVGESMQVHVKLGESGGRFGPWILLDTPKLIDVFPGTGAAGKPTLAAIHTQPRRVVEYQLETKANAHRPALLLSALPETTRKRAFAHGDIDNDGDLDLVMSDPERARLSVMLEDNGHFHTQNTPTLAGIQCIDIGDADGDGKNDLIIASTEEESLSWVSGAGPLSTFPKPIAALPQIDGKPAIPIAVTVNNGEVLAILRNKSNAAGLFRLKVGGTAEDAVQLADLGRMRRDPQRLIYADLDGAHGADVAYLLPSEGLQTLFRQKDGKYRKASETGSSGFTKRMEDGALSLTGSGANRALFVVRERYARRFRFDGQGQPVILSQDNGPEGNPSMAMGTILPDGTRLFLDRKATPNRLFRLSPSKPTVSIDLPAITPTRILPHGQDVLVIGRRGVLRVPFARSYGLRAVRRHEPPTRKTRYYAGHTADLDGDGKLEIAMLDSDIHGIHVLVPQGDKLLRGLSFPVFESTNSESQEPRALRTGDVNGDGLDDLLMLAHDRLLIYYQER